MSTNFNPARRIMIIILLVIAFVSIMSIACDEPVNPCSNACGITAPRPADSPVQEVIDWIEKTDPQGESNNW